MGLTVIVDPDSASAGQEPLALTFDAPRLVIGRSDGCEVRLPDTSVSGRHATLRQHGGTYLLVDEGSTNGTYLGAVRMAPHAPRVIESGDRVRVGRVWIELRLSAVAQPSTPQATRELALRLVQRALDSVGEPSSPRLRVVAGPDQGKELPLARSGAPYVLGRGNGVDLMLDEPDASRRHVQVTRKAEQVLVRDLGSKNGTLLNGQRLPPERDVPWRPGDELSLGHDRFVYDNPALEALSELERCADEPLTDEPAALEAPPDASSTPSPSPSPGPAEPSPSPPASPAPAPAAAPVVAAPRNVRREHAARTGWGPSDVLIVLLALGVLGLSLGGLWLVFRLSERCLASGGGRRVRLEVVQEGE